MTHSCIERFLEGAAFKMSDVVKPVNELQQFREVYNDYALLVFKLDKALTVAEIIDSLESVPGLTMMYHHMPSRDTEFGQSFCFFQEPGLGEMFQINFSTNAEGKVEEVDVKIYTSLEIMVSDLESELERVPRLMGEFAYRITKDELISYFL